MPVGEIINERAKSSTVWLCGVRVFETINFQFTVPFVYVHNIQFNYLLPNDLYALLGKVIHC